jgi:hypothetical protein
MKRLLSIAVLAAAWTAYAQGTSEAILGYSAPSPVVTSVSAAAGWTFQAASDLTVTDLGCFNSVFTQYPAITSIEVGLWNHLGSLLASNFITPGSTLFDQTRYESTSASLKAGEIYHLGIYSPDISSLIIGGAAALGSVSASAGVLFRGTALSTNSFAFPKEQPGPDGSLYVGPNFRYQTGVPEPSSGLLLGLAGLLLAARRRNLRP